jgi:Ca2+-binding RTX toxin-like protein
VLYDAETDTDYIVPLFGDALTITSLAQFQAFVDSIAGIGPAASPYAEGDSIDVSTSLLIASTTNDDLINGTDDGEFIDGGSGDDTIYGNGGNDTIIGGAGNDYLNPGNSDDFDDIRPGSGNDTIDLSEQTNSFSFLYYGDLSQYYAPLTTGIVATLSGGDGDNDTILKNGTDTDTIIGLDVPLYNDFGFGLVGTELNDTFILTNMNGSNPFGAFFEITGGEGIDSYVIDGRAEGRLNFDEGTDFNPATQGLVLNLATGVITNDGFGNAETITYLNDGSLARVRATNNNDSIIGSDADETFGLLGGNDTLDAGGGFDRLRYDQGNVTGLVVDLQAGTATGTIDWRGDVFAFNHQISNIERVDGSRNNADSITGNAADNFFRGRGGDDTLVGGAGNDTLQGDEGDDQLFGGDGDDFILDGAGNDYADGGAGNDTFLMGSGFDTFVGGDGWDRLDYSNANGFANGSFTLQIDLLAGTSFAVEDPTNANDSLSGIEEIGAENLQIDVIAIGDNVANAIYTGFGADSLVGNAGDDTLSGGAGNDTLRGGDGRDNLRGGDGDDLLDASGGTVESNGFGDFVRAGKGQQHDHRSCRPLGGRRRHRYLLRRCVRLGRSRHHDQCGWRRNDGQQCRRRRERHLHVHSFLHRNRGRRPHHEKRKRRPLVRVPGRRRERHDHRELQRHGLRRLSRRFGVQWRRRGHGRPCQRDGDGRVR